MATVGCCPSNTGNQHQCHSHCHHHHRHKVLICQMYTVARPAQVHPSCQVLVVWLGTLAHLRNPMITPLTKTSSSWPAVHLTAQLVQTRKSKVVRTCCGLKPQPGFAPMHPNPNPTATQIWLHAPFLLGDYMKNQGPGRHKTELRFFSELL